MQQQQQMHQQQQMNQQQQQHDLAMQKQQIESMTPAAPQPQTMGGVPLAPVAALPQQPAVQPAAPQPVVQQAAPTAQTVHVQVPAGCAPGMQFQVSIGGQVKTIMCPQGAGPGSVIAVNV